MIAHWPMAAKIIVMVALVMLGGWIGKRIERWMDRRR